MTKYYIVNIYWDIAEHKGGYKVFACALTLKAAAETMKAIKTPWRTLVVRDGSTGKRYCYADLVDTYRNQVKVA